MSLKKTLVSLFLIATFGCAQNQPYLDARAMVEAGNVDEGLALMEEEARKNPGSLKYGSAGLGSILHTTMELLAHETRTKFQHIPYRGEAPAITALLQGDIDVIAAHVQA